MTASADVARRRSFRLAAALPCLGALLSGCALPLDAEVDRASDAAHYVLHYDHPVGPEANLLDRALARCDEKVSKAETACVTAAIAGAGLSTAGLIALVPGCRAGRLCRYDVVTRDRLGFVSATATDFVRRWRIDVDVRHPAADAAHVPVTVIDRDDFDAPGAKPG